MLDIDSIRNTLTTNLNKDKAQDVDIDINVNVISETNGKFNIRVHDSEVVLEEGNLDQADITVGFVNKDVMIEMFTQGANPMGLVMGGKMTFNGDMAKGKSIKGLFVNNE
jgi:alkyl sulfatase BDS1-like metallo-beta-lactamase superfamily hydrolase